MNLCGRLVLAVMCIVVAGCVTEPAPQRGRTPPSAPLPPPPPVSPPAAGAKEGASTPRVLSPPAAPTSGGIGYYQDRQEQQLRERVDGTGVRLVRTGDTIRLVLPGNAAFTTNGDQLQPRFVDLLTTVAAVLKEYSKTVIDVKGYTDSTGSFEHNQQLSAQRAQAVGNLLISRQIAAARIRTAGYGPRNPVADNKTDSGRAQNRRIEIDLVPAS